MPMVVNDAETVRELTELYPQYERALVENDVPTLTRLFWSSAYAMRFGVGENLYGMEEIEAFRKARPSVGLAREVLRLDVVTFGKDFGSVTLEFARGEVRGRQSQVWVRLPEGWRIVAAHVSLLPPKA
jgi:hypothetical protein